MQLIELHILRNTPIGRENGSDDGSPKDTMFGDHLRARTSYQCQRAAIRKWLKENSDLPMATRTLEVMEILKNEIKTPKTATPEAIALVIAEATTNLWAKPDDKKVQKGLNYTQSLVFAGPDEIQRASKLLSDNMPELVKAAQAVLDERVKTKQKAEEAKDEKAEDGAATKTEKEKKATKAEQAFEVAVKAVTDEFEHGTDAIDVALFGRTQLSKARQEKFEGAAHTAHAIGVNRMVKDPDFFTAMDDRTGVAALLSVSELTSACFYHYHALDMNVLKANLDGKDTKFVQRAVEAFIRASVLAVPRGKRATSAPYTKPAFVFAVISNGDQRNLANAFERPVQPGQDMSLSASAIKRFDSYWGTLQGKYGEKKVSLAKTLTVCDQEAEGLLENLSGLEAKNFDDLATSIARAAVEF